MIKQSIFYFFLLCFTLCNAQKENYIQDFSNKLNVSLAIDRNELLYNFSNNNTNQTYIIKTNESKRLTISGRYKFLGLTIGFAPHFLNNDPNEALKGKSDIQLIKLRVIIKQFIQEFTYNTAKGFYIDNTKDFVPDWQANKDRYLQLSNFKIKLLSGKTTYVWNKKFSFKSHILKNEKQLKSAGSFIPSLSYALSTLNNPENEILNINQRNFDINLNIGYIYNFTFGKAHNYFAALGVFPGGGIKFATLKQKNENGILETKRKTYQNFSTSGQLSFGYNTNKIFTGVQINTYGVSYNKTPETKIENNNIYFQLYFGYRFKAPQTIKKIFNKVKK